MWQSAGMHAPASRQGGSEGADVACGPVGLSLAAPIAGLGIQDVCGAARRHDFEAGRFLGISSGFFTT